MPFCAYCGVPVAETSYRPCLSCGNPTNGAPRPQLATGGKNVHVIAIIAVVLAVLAIPVGGILAAIAIPNFMTATQRAKQKRTMVDIRAVARELESHATAHGSYPPSIDTKNDGWGHPLRYECIEQAERPCAGYAIVSAGKDGRFDFGSAGEYEEGTTNNFNEDIVFANGSFIRYPEGATP